MSDKKYGKKTVGRTREGKHSSGSAKIGAGQTDASVAEGHSVKNFFSSRDAVGVSVVEKVSSLIVQPMILSEFAKQANLPVSDIIVSMLKEKKMYAKNHLLSEQEVRDLCRYYEIEAITRAAPRQDSMLEKVQLVTDNAHKRAPVIVVMGHVDHGKTTLLDFIRKTRVAAKEKGGITQHLGAYEVSTSHGPLVFLDTPGHEAFSKIRRRGAFVADIAVLVIAADDGIMPQTVESIKAIKTMNVPAIVAINKMDKADPSRIETIKRQLTQYNLLPEEWGGSTICVPVSAKEGTGVDQLLEMIALQADVMELAAATDIPAQGYVLESKLEKGRGFVATLLCRQGSLKVGQFFSVNGVVGKVSSMVNSYGKELKEVGPSIPVLVSGFSEMPEVGAFFEVIKEEQVRKMRSSSSEQKMGINQHNAAQLQGKDGSNEQKFCIIVKADTHSSLEAITDGLHKIDKPDVKNIVIVKKGIGDINESDLLLAEGSGCVIIGFNVKTEHNALSIMKSSKIAVHVFSIIYKLFEEIERLAVKKKEIKYALTKIGEATVLKVFDIKKLGIVAGAIIKDGRFSEKGKVVVLRGRKKVGEGKIKSLQRDKKSVKEVHSGYECAFMVDAFDQWEQDDLVECYLEVPA